LLADLLNECFFQKPLMSCKNGRRAARWFDRYMKMQTWLNISICALTHVGSKKNRTGREDEMTLLVLLEIPV